MGGWVSVAPKPEQKDVRTQSTSIYPFLPPNFFKMVLVELYQDVLTPKEFVPGGMQQTQNLAPYESTDQ